jgi:PAS domain S-box-containing protein
MPFSLKDPAADLALSDVAVAVTPQDISPEHARIATLRRYGILDTPRDMAFDRIVALAAELMETPIALVSFVDVERQWFKAAVGINATQTPRAQSFCQFAIEQKEVYVVLDIHADPRFADPQLVRFDRTLRFYAAAPLITPDGFCLGTLCVLDHTPRSSMSERECRRLADLASIAADLLEQRREREMQRQDRAEIALVRDILTCLSKSDSFETALEVMQTRILKSFGAYTCRIWERRYDEAFVHLLSRVSDDPAPPHDLEDIKANRPVPLAELGSASLFLSHDATMWRMLEDDENPTWRVRRAIAAGIGSLVAATLLLGSRQFVMVLTFRGAADDLPDRSALLGRITQAIRPVLQRKLVDEQRAMLGAALEATHDGVLIAENSSSDVTQYKIVFVNATLLHQTGYEASEMIGGCWSMLNAVATDEEDVARVRKSLRDTTAVRTERYRRRRDGSSFWAELTIVPLRDAQGTASHWVIIQRDLTEHRAELQAQRDREQRLIVAKTELGRRTSQLLRTQTIARLGSWRRQLGADVMEWSDLVYQMFGVSADTFTPTLTDVWALIHPDDQASLRSLIDRMERTGEGYKVVYRTIGQDGIIRHIWSDCASECDESGTIVAVNGIVLDITEQEHAQAMLLQGEKLRSIGQLTGGIAHDFNNLLTVISINLAMLGEMIAPDDPAQELCGMALKASETAAQLTSNLLAFARRQSLQPEQCDINTMLTGLHEMVSHTIGERHPIVIECAPDLPTCLLDRSGFESAMLNLLVNSRDALPDGGEISIRTSTHWVGTERRKDDIDLMPGLYMCVAVSDGGIGIAPHLIERVFEPFFTTKPVGKGTGLGLSTVIGFVRQSGGDVQLTSRLHEGTQVRLYLPVGTADQKRPQRLKEGNPRPPAFKYPD